MSRVSQVQFSFGCRLVSQIKKYFLSFGIESRSVKIKFYLILQISIKNSKIVLFYNIVIGVKSRNCLHFNKLCDIISILLTFRNSNTAKLTWYSTSVACKTNFSQTYRKIHHSVYGKGRMSWRKGQSHFLHQSSIVHIQRIGTSEVYVIRVLVFRQRAIDVWQTNGVKMGSQSSWKTYNIHTK